MPPDVLVIGYGNPLRGDDGLGPAVAEAIGAQDLPGVRVLVVHQLTPELAADLTEVQLAVFVDAAVGGEPVTAARLQCDTTEDVMTHAPDPRCLLVFARAVYGRVPEAWLVTVAGVDFGYRDDLTPAGLENALEAVDYIRFLILESSGA